MKNKVEIKKSKIKNAGRGVFASVDIRKGEVIEVCPILIFRETDTDLVMKTRLGSYVYAYDKSGSMFALGYGSLYNHSITPNATYELLEYPEKTEQDSELIITAIKSIGKNEEIYFDYGNDYLAENNAE